MFLGSATAPLELEVISRLPAQAGNKPPLLFVHGAFAGAWCWEEHFLDFFAGLGYPSYALSLRGHAGSAGRERLHWNRLADYVTDVAEVAVGLGERTILIGHSMGGMIVQKYLERTPAPAAVLMCSVPPSGLMWSSLQLMWRDPMLWMEMGVITHAGPQYGSRSLARRALFSPDAPDAVVDRLMSRAQEESSRVLADLTWADLPAVTLVRRTPLLVLGAEHDALVPPSEVLETARRLGAECEIVPRVAHVMMFEPGWDRVARRVAEWLARQGH